MSERPRLLITGGSGYLGQRLVCCTQSLWDVTATYLSCRPQTLGCRWVRLDVRDTKEVSQLFEQVLPHVVIHTAARRSGEDLRGVNVDGTRNVVLTSLSVGARMIHLSTDVLFDGRKGNYRESDPPSPITPYGCSKADAEAQLIELMPQATIVRTSLIYGFDPPDHHTRWMLETLRRGLPVRLFTDERRCPIWVETLAAALVELATLEYNGVLNVAGGQALDRYQFGTRLLRCYGADLSQVTPALATTSGQTRPLNCTLDITNARRLLKAPLLGVDEVIVQHQNLRKGV